MECVTRLDQNPGAGRLAALASLLRRRRISAFLVCGEANLLALTGLVCDNGCLLVFPRDASSAAPARDEGCACCFFTDFRYVPMARRVAPWLKTVELKRGETFAERAKAMLVKFGVKPRNLGFESSVSAARYLQLQKAFPRLKLLDIESDLLSLRAEKTPDELTRITRAAALNDRIWSLARRDFRSGMTEKQLQRILRTYMNMLGDGEAFETIVSVGANAAECHHVPDDTVWRRGEPLLVDMGVKLDGVMSDMTRCLKPSGAFAATAAASECLKVYDIVLAANRAAIAAAKPGMTCAALDAVARRVIAAAGYGKAFGHALGHGVGYEIHEAPTVAPRSETVLRPGMVVTIEPGIYLPGRLGVRIEDLVVITATGCEVLSHSRK